MKKGVRALGYNGLRDTREGKEGEGVGLRVGWGGVMDSLAEDPTGGAGIGCPGLKRETGDWLLQ